MSRMRFKQMARGGGERRKKDDDDDDEGEEEAMKKRRNPDFTLHIFHLVHLEFGVLSFHKTVFFATSSSQWMRH